MTIKVKITNPDKPTNENEGGLEVTYDPKKPEQPDRVVQLKMSKALDGALLIKDHDYFDIFITPDKKRILTVPKMGVGEGVYQHQKTYLDTLTRRGVLKVGSLEGGMVNGTLQSLYVENEDVSTLQAILAETETYMKAYRLENQLAKEYENSIEDRFVNPNDEERTDAGEIPPEEERRKYQSDIPYYTYAGYGYMF